MTYQDELEATLAATAAQVRAALTLFEAGQLTADALASVVASYVAAGNSAAAALADLSLAAALTVSAGEAVAPLGITRPADDPDRLAKAAATLLSLDSASPERWERLARAEGQEAAARAYSAAVKASPRVTGWTRGLSANACQLCTWWRRDGQVWPDHHEMPTHTGCTCNPVPITR